MLSEIFQGVTQEHKILKSCFLRLQTIYLGCMLYTCRSISEFFSSAQANFKAVG